MLLLLLLPVPVVHLRVLVLLRGLRERGLLPPPEVERAFMVLAARPTVHKDRGAIRRPLAFESGEGGRRRVVVDAVRVVLLARAGARLRGLVIAGPRRAAVVDFEVVEMPECDPCFHIIGHLETMRD